MDAVDVEALFEVELPADAPNAKTLSPIANLPPALHEVIKSARAALRQGIRTLTVGADKAAKQWQGLYAPQRKKYEQLMARSAEKSVAALQTKLERAKKHSESLAKAEKEMERLQLKLTNLRSARGKARAVLKAARRRRFDIRMETAKRWEERLGGTVRISITHLGDRKAYGAALKELLKGSYVHERDQQSVVGAIEPTSLVELIQNQNEAPIVAVGLAHETAKKILQFLAQRPIELLSLESVSLPDIPEISFEVEPGILKPLNTLSVGGKGTVVMLLAMIEGNAPLIIDQPEDSLDTVFIYEQIVKKVREQKEMRQFVFATHNPNVLVSADADLSFVLEASADKGSVKSHGGIDRKDTNELLILHLEGGETAFRVRGMKYRNK